LRGIVKKIRGVYVGCVLVVEFRHQVAGTRHQALRPAASKQIVTRGVISDLRKGRGKREKVFNVREQAAFVAGITLLV
jgi:hypothetical protein